MNQTQRANRIQELQTEWRLAMSEGRHADVTRLAGQIDQTLRIQVTTDSTRMSVVEINDALKRMGIPV